MSHVRTEHVRWICFERVTDPLDNAKRWFAAPEFPIGIGSLSDADSCGHVDLSESKFFSSAFDVFAEGFMQR